MNKHGVKLAILAVCVLASGCQLFTATEQVPPSAAVQSEVYQSSFAAAAAVAAAQLELSRQQQRWPALTAAVAWRGQLVWAGASGYADLAARQLNQILNQRFPLVKMMFGRPGHIEDGKTEGGKEK